MKTDNVKNRTARAHIPHTISRAALFVFLLFPLLVFSCFPARYMGACLEGILLWATCVLPSTLPFLFLTGLFTRLGYVRRLSKNCAPLTGALFRLPGIGGYCLAMSFLSGYPVGAKTLADLAKTGMVSPSEANKMSVLCSSSGPLFILGSVGMGMFSDAKVGWILLASHFAAILLGGILLRAYGKTPAAGAPPAPTMRDENVLYECIHSSIVSVLCVGGFIAVFYTLATMLSDWHVFAPLFALLSAAGVPETQAAGFARGLVEMTGGCRALAASATPLAVAGCAFLITFGGACVLFQQTVYFRQAGVKLGFFLPVKLLQSCLAAALAFGAACLFL